MLPSEVPPDSDRPEAGVTAPLHGATPDEIRGGGAADAHFLRTCEVLRAEGRDPHVVAEVRAESLPDGWPWAVVAGTAEVLSLLEGRAVDVLGVPEGSLIYPEEPVVTIAGKYLAFGDLASQVLGALCHASGVATTAARLKQAAGGRPVFSFCARLVHPAVAPVVERAAYVGGCDAVTTVKGADLVGVTPVATMHRDLALLLGEPRAWIAFDEAIDPDVPRVATVDAMLDERAGAIAAADALGERLAAVRLDVPASRRGDLAHIVREVRWELDARGHSRVRIMVSGNLDEGTVRSLTRVADGFCVEDPIAAAPVVDLGLEIVEVDDEPRARRGMLSGRKHLWRCESCGNRGIAPGRARLEPCPRCGGRLTSVAAMLMREGVPEGKPEDAATARERALREAAEAGRVPGRS